ncbi:MAG: VOC family protein [bacterium]|jgi:lactoylglutathione lyase|nr:VOC family protein [bacterium]
MLKPTKLDHLALKVTDMEQSLAFYQHVLGLEIVRRSGPNEAGGYAAVLRAGQQLLDLFSRPDFVSADKDKPVGMDHLCLQIDAASIDAVIADLQQAQVDIFWGPVERQGHTSVYVYDPDGMHVELRVATPV